MVKSASFKSASVCVQKKLRKKAVWWLNHHHDLGNGLLDSRKVGGLLGDGAISKTESPTKRYFGYPDREDTLVVVPQIKPHIAPKSTMI